MGILGYRPIGGGKRTPTRERYRGPGEPREKALESRIKVDRARQALEDLKTLFGDPG